MENYLEKYLKHIQMETHYIVSDINCEICNCKENTVIRENISLGKDLIGKLPVVACNNCGFLYQNPRFEEKFYEDFYSKNYRNVIFGKNNPDERFINDQTIRGEKVFNFLKPYLKEKGSILDVGSSLGCMLIPFLKNGWHALGTDPDKGYVEYGKNKLKLPVIDVKAERMNLEPNSFDVIIIMGSLEHVFDPNLTLEICRKAAKEDSLLLLEGRGHPQSHSSVYFNHNHHRYFTLNSIKLMMLKFGWEPIITTDDQICGASRAGGIYCLGKMKTKPSFKEFKKFIQAGNREKPSELLEKFQKNDRHFGNL